MQRETISPHDDQLELFHPSQAVVHLKQLSAKREWAWFTTKQNIMWHHPGTRFRFLAGTWGSTVLEPCVTIPTESPALPTFEGQQNGVSSAEGRLHNCGRYPIVKGLRCPCACIS